MCFCLCVFVCVSGPLLFSQTVIKCSSEIEAVHEAKRQKTDKWLLKWSRVLVKWTRFRLSLSGYKRLLSIFPIFISPAAHGLFLPQINGFPLRVVTVIRSRAFLHVGSRFIRFHHGRRRRGFLWALICLVVFYDAADNFIWCCNISQCYTQTESLRWTKRIYWCYFYLLMIFRRFQRSLFKLHQSRFLLAGTKTHIKKCWV